MVKPRPSDRSEWKEELSLSLSDADSCVRGKKGSEVKGWKRRENEEGGRKKLVGQNEL